MFQRRKKQSWLSRARDMIWPRAGWRRVAAYFKHRIGRMTGTPHAIAAGFAFGAAVSFTPFLGFHILIAAALCLLCRVSIVASVIGTIVGNPWTFPFIWAVVYAAGLFLTGMEPVPFDSESLSMTFLIDHFWNVFVPLVVGGVPVGAVAWIAFYFPMRGAVARYQAARRARLAPKSGGTE